MLSTKVPSSQSGPQAAPDFSLCAKDIVSEKRPLEIPKHVKLVTETRRALVPRDQKGDKIDLLETDSSEVEQVLSRQAVACAKVLLMTSLYPENQEGIRLLSKIITQTIYPQVFVTGEPKNPFLFLLGPHMDLGDSADNGIDYVDVVPGTTISLLRDPRTREDFIPLSDGKRIPYPVSLADLLDLDLEDFDDQTKSAQLKLQRVMTARKKWAVQEPEVMTAFPERKIEKRNSHLINSAIVPIEPPHWEPCKARTAAEALSEHVKPSVAAWCLERLGGRRFVVLNPWSESDEETIRDNHKDTRPKIRNKARKKFLEKFGPVIVEDEIESAFCNDLKSPGRMGTHHKWPVSWGGGNEDRSVVDNALHSYIHDDFENSIRRVCACLGNEYADLILVSEELRAHLESHPEVVDRLEKIRHVRVRDNLVEIEILWPTESYCLSSLLVFEHQYKGIWGPADNRYLDRTAVNEEEERARAVSDAKQLDDAVGACAIDKDALFGNDRQACRSVAQRLALIVDQNADRAAEVFLIAKAIMAHPDPKVRRCAFAAIGAALHQHPDLTDKAFFAGLTKTAVNDADEKVRDEAQKALTVGLGGRTKHSEQALDVALSLAELGDVQTRRNAQEIIRLIVDKCPFVVTEDLFRTAASIAKKDSDVPVRVAALGTLCEMAGKRLDFGHAILESVVAIAKEEEDPRVRSCAQEVVCRELKRHPGLADARLTRFVIDIAAKGEGHARLMALETLPVVLNENPHVADDLMSACITVIAIREGDKKTKVLAHKALRTLVKKRHNLTSAILSIANGFTDDANKAVRLGAQEALYCIYDECPGLLNAAEIGNLGVVSVRDLDKRVRDAALKNLGLSLERKPEFVNVILDSMKAAALGGDNEIKIIVLENIPSLIGARPKMPDRAFAAFVVELAANHEAGEVRLAGHRAVGSIAKYCPSILDVEIAAVIESSATKDVLADVRDLAKKSLLLVKKERGEGLSAPIRVDRRVADSSYRLAS